MGVRRNQALVTESTREWRRQLTNCDRMNERNSDAILQSVLLAHGGGIAGRTSTIIDCCSC